MTSDECGDDEQWRCQSEKNSRGRRTGVGILPIVKYERSSSQSSMFSGIFGWSASSNNNNTHDTDNTGIGDLTANVWAEEGAHMPVARENTPMANSEGEHSDDIQMTSVSLLFLVTSGS